VNQLVATALAEKLAALMTVEHLGRAERGNRGRFLEAMARIPDVEPDRRDRLPAGMRPNRRLRPPAKARRRTRTGKGKK
jgi:hypothetical protein